MLTKAIEMKPRNMKGKWAYGDGSVTGMFNYRTDMLRDRSYDAVVVKKSRQGFKPVSDVRCLYCGCRIHEVCSLDEHVMISEDCRKQRAKEKV